MVNSDAKAASGGWLLRHRVGVVAVVGLLIMGGALAHTAIGRYRNDHLAGQTRRVTLEWTCLNDIGWDQPGGRRWWAGHDVELPERFETSPPTTPLRDYTLARRVATGSLHFDSDTVATFTSDAGGHIRLRREPDTTFHTADCRIE